ncbi:LOW QUALITY PROTEIN: CD109 antigen [Liasis olivaceus]
MRLLLEVAPATRRSSWLVPILPLIRGFMIVSSLVAAGKSAGLLAENSKGKPMKGKVTIDFFSLFRAQNTKITKILEINGSLNFILENPEIKDITFRDEDMLHPAPIEIIVVITESLTGISQNASTTVFPQLHNYAVDFLEYPRFLKLSLNFFAMLKVRRTDNHQHLMNKRIIMTLVKQPNTVYHIYDDENELEKNNRVCKLSYPVPEDGVIQTVFYVHDNGEIINSVLHIPVQLTFKNQINMHWSKNKAGPAEDITLIIKVKEPQTTIGLLVVDKSTNSLGKRNDITEDAIYHEISYDTKSSYGKAGNAFSIFQNSKVWILTDANLSEHEDYGNFTVTLDTSDIFEILIISNDINAIGNRQSVWIPSEDGKTIFFPIKPKQIGEIPTGMIAISPIASDALLQRLLVKHVYLLLVLPLLSLTCKFHLSGDKLSPSISGLESLVKMLYDCGEQDMINFAPNIYIQDYLSKTGNLQTKFKSKVVSYMREGYQRKLLYKRPDGSFNAFCKSDPSGIFVLRSFVQVQPYIDTDLYILETAAWILSRLKFSGEGRVLRTELQGGTSCSLSHTAYILTALLEYQFKELGFWTKPSSGLSSSWQPHSADIKVVGYAFLSHFIQQGIPIMKWLSKQRNHLGGYSTQDITLALALSTFATLTADSVTEIDVTGNGSLEENPTVFQIGCENFVLKTKEFPATQPVRVTISANGHGFAIFQLNVIYNMKNSHTSKRRRSAQNQEAFDLDVYVKDDKEDLNSLTLNVCTRYLGAGSSSRSGVAVMEFGLLSGFSLSPGFVSLDGPVKKVEKDDGKIHLYLDSLNKTQVCMAIPVVRDFKVANTQDASVTVMDYYEPRGRTVKSYNSLVMQSLSCTFCEDNECNFCKSDASDSPVSLSFELLVLLILSACYMVSDLITG